MQVNPADLDVPVPYIDSWSDRHIIIPGIATDGGGLPAVLPGELCGGVLGRVVVVPDGCSYMS
ncbi:MAG: hypothetical protein K2I18_09835 [Paramuribaculum sp.]|nr:hypothetical protein [Paramuribaculum sp.]